MHFGAAIVPINTSTVGLILVLLFFGLFIVSLMSIASGEKPGLRVLIHIVLTACMVLSYFCFSNIRECKKTKNDGDNCPVLFFNVEVDK